MARFLRRLIFSLLLSLSLLQPEVFVVVVDSASFKILNKCHHTVWPGLLSGAGTPQLPTTGFALRSGKSRTIPIPSHWSGRIWGRTFCSRDPAGKFACLTADCGSGKVECGGGGAAPPATLAEFTLNGDQNLDFYDVSLVDGYNLPVLVVALGGGGACSPTGCLVDLNGACPAGLSVRAAGGSRRRVACRSACEAFADPRYCCSGEYGTPDTCGPTVYSEFFKRSCPRAYSYAYDDGTSTFTCEGASYLIVFCPLPYTSQKLLELRKDGAALPLVNKTTMYISSHHRSG